MDSTKSPQFVRQPDGSYINPFNPYMHGPITPQYTPPRPLTPFDGDRFLHWNGVAKISNFRGECMNPQPTNPRYAYDMWVHYEKVSQSNEIQRIANTYPNPDAAVAFLHATHKWPDHALSGTQQKGQ